MFVFDNKKRSANQVVKYTVIVMFVLSTAHIVSCIRTSSDHFPNLHPTNLSLIRLEPFGVFAHQFRASDNMSKADGLCSWSIHRSLQEGFFDWRPKSPENYFNSKAVPLNLANKSLYGANMIVGDGLMVRRKPLDPDPTSANYGPLNVDIPPLDHLPKELAHHRPSDPFDRCDCRYVLLSSSEE